jgi:hypothetical protein
MRQRARARRVEGARARRRFNTWHALARCQPRKAPRARQLRESSTSTALAPGQAYLLSISAADIADNALPALELGFTVKKDAEASGSTWY